MRLIPYILYLLVIGLEQTILRDLLSIYGVTFDLTALLVLGVALYKSEQTALWFGFVAGLVSAAGQPTLIGWHALVLAFVGLTAFHVRERLNLDSLLAKLLLMFGGIFFHNIAVLIIDQAGGFLYLLGANALPGAVYTSLLALLFFGFKEGLFTYQRLKAIF